MGVIEPLLRVRDLRVVFPTAAGEVRALDGVSFDLLRGRALGVVGESGCGKSTLACAIPRLLSAPGTIAGGSIELGGEDVLAASPAALRRLRGGRVGMVFQDAAAALDPAFTVGSQLRETLRLYGFSRAQARTRAAELLALAGVDAPERRLRQYPHELSGGQKQRVMIALALCGEPELLIADEPTSALDVSVQAQILRLLADLRSRLNMAVLLITHDLGVAAQLCDDILVLYAGRVCERGDVEAVFRSPRHEYTRALLACAPSLEGEKTRARPIPGAPPDLIRPLAGCAFAPRCPRAADACRARRPEEVCVGPGHFAACHCAKDGEGA